jgi:alpha-L-rhamnosidase
MRSCAIKPLALLCLAFLCFQTAHAQDGGPSAIPAGQLDPARSITHPQLFSSFHKPLPEQYIWTREDSAVTQTTFIRYERPGLNDKTAPHYFRVSFNVSAVPKDATLYLAGPRSVTAYVNGALAGHVAANNLNPLGMHVFQMDVAHLLKPGRNVLALQVVRGRGVHGFLNSALAMQQVFGEILVAKIIPAASGVDAPAILISGPQWKGTLHAASGWQRPDYNDSAWPSVAALSPIEGSIDLFQWNADAGLYDWPGYEGASPFLAHMYLPAAKVDDVQTGRSSFDNLESLTSGAPNADFAVKLGSIAPGNEFAPEITLDFGREVNGRVEFVSDSDSQAVVSIQYGESKSATDNEPYLGVNVLRIPPHGSAHGPKSAFRYARIRFLAGGPDLKFKTIHLEDIYYPVEYQGSFESSDPLLNRIWETGAYTVHLCMQDDIWDAPKRDRGRWMGDLDVTGRVISSVFADRSLMESTMTAVIGDSPVKRDVNTIAGYSALWITGQADFYRHSGDLEYLRSQRQPLLELLQVMDAELDSDGLFTNPGKHKIFVDWSTGFSADTPEARAATHFEFYLAYREAAFLLSAMGDEANAAARGKMADRLGRAAQEHLLDRGANTFGARWQTNAIAVDSGAATPVEEKAIWSDVLSHVTAPMPSDAAITPYYGYYALSAMARLGHRADALKWMRQYWGGMLAEGATSFWEAYDPRWPKQDFHASLEADGKKGYYVSLAHGWASGPTAWLMEQVLGIEPTAAGFHEVNIRPDLAGLQWARGAEPTPRGLIRVSIDPDMVRISLPPETIATISLPFPAGSAIVIENGKPTQVASSEDGARSTVKLNQAGEYTFAVKGAPKQ